MATDWHLNAPRPTGLVRPVRLDEDGITGPTRGQARSSRWRAAPSRGWYVPSVTDPGLVEQRILEQSVRAPGGAVTGWASLRFQGAGYFDGLAPDGRTVLRVQLVEGVGRLASDETILVSREQLSDDDLVVRHSVRCTTAERALFDEVRRIGELREAVVACDMAFAAKLTSLERMRAYLSRRRRWRGHDLVAGALDLACEHSWSPMETRLRLIWVLDAGWARPLCNRHVLDVRGVVLGRPDLLDAETGVAGEFDGEDHRDQDRHRVDVGREDRFRRVGLEPVAFVGADVRDPQLVVDRLTAARERAISRRATVPPTWRLGPAPEPLDDVLARRDLLPRVPDLEL